MEKFIHYRNFLVRFWRFGALVAYFFSPRKHQNIKFHQSLFVGIFASIFLMLGCKTAQTSTKENPDQFFKISLYSVGTGIDKEAEAVVINTIDKYKKKGYNFEYVMNHWGREGEKHYCIFGQKLSSDQYKQIFDEMTLLLKDRQAHIYEKQACPEQ